jgi:transcriptional regulator with XRE-family HTH domain
MGRKKLVATTDVDLARRNREIYERLLRDSGPHIRELRILHNMSQIDFANIVGVSPTLLSKIEHGHHTPTPRTAFGICVGFHFSLEKLLSGWNPEELIAEATRRMVELRQAKETGVQDTKDKTRSKMLVTA